MVYNIIKDSFAKQDANLEKEHLYGINYCLHFVHK